LLRLSKNALKPRSKLPVLLRRLVNKLLESLNSKGKSNYVKRKRRGVESLKRLND